MPREIERKFLLAEAPGFGGDPGGSHGGSGWRDAVTRTIRIVQFYIFVAPDRSLRVRISDETKAELALKTGSGMDRGEFEYEIPVVDAHELMEHRIGALVEKTRHHVPLGAWTLEIDVFEGALAGLELVEVELEAADDSPSLPPFVGREVTGDPRYSNARLALDGRPADEDEQAP